MYTQLSLEMVIVLAASPTIWSSMHSSDLCDICGFVSGMKNDIFVGETLCPQADKKIKINDCKVGARRLKEKQNIKKIYT